MRDRVAWCPRIEQGDTHMTEAFPDPKLGEPFLLTPGPLSTAFDVKEAMLKDWGSWDDDFRAMTRELRKRKCERSTRDKLNSPGRPPVWQRETLCRFWRAVAEGLSSEDAAVEAGVSAPVGTRWFRSSGGMPPTHLAPSAARQCIAVAMHERGAFTEEPWPFLRRT